jgi:hypothetical protein
MILIRDAAGENHPVIGIAALGSSRTTNHASFHANASDNA